MQHLVDQVLKAPIGGKRKRIAIKFLRTNTHWWEPEPKNLVSAFEWGATPQGEYWWDRLYEAWRKATSLSV